MTATWRNEKAIAVQTKEIFHISGIAMENPLFIEMIFVSNIICAQKKWLFFLKLNPMLNKDISFELQQSHGNQENPIQM